MTDARPVFPCDRCTKLTMTTTLPLSRTLGEARAGAIRLYRAACKAAPEIVRSYRLQYTPQDLRRKFRFQFEQNKTITDPQLVDLLVLKGENDLEEALLVYKTKSHVLYYLEDINNKPNDQLTLTDFKDPKEREVLSKFFQEDPRGWDSFERFA